MSEVSNESWDTNEEPDELTLKELDELCLKFKELREKKEALEAQVSEIETERKFLEMKIIDHLKESGKENWKGDFGTVSIRINKQVRQPDSMEAKLALFEYLREQGIFESMVSINSKTLTSWATKEIEAKEKNNEFGWVPPGLQSPGEYFSLSLRKK